MAIITVISVVLLFISEIILGDHSKPPTAPRPVGHVGYNVCPVLLCDKTDGMPKECIKPQFIIGSDGKTPCRICDASYCGRQQDVCPRIRCPAANSIETYCRKPNYVIGTDSITKCRVCDTNACGKVAVCPTVHCPKSTKIPSACRLRQYVIGGDGVSMCRGCDKDACKETKVHAPGVYVQ